MGPQSFQRASLALTDARHAVPRAAWEGLHALAARSSSAPAARRVSIHPGGGRRGGGGGGRGGRERGERRAFQPLSLRAGHHDYSYFTDVRLQVGGEVFRNNAPRLPGMTWKHRGRTIMIMGSGPVFQQTPELEDNLHFSSRPPPGRREADTQRQATARLSPAFY